MSCHAHAHAHAQKNDIRSLAYIAGYIAVWISLFTERTDEYALQLEPTLRESVAVIDL